MDNNKFEIDDIKNNRIFAVLSYIPFLFIIPLIVKRNSRFVKFSLNQGICLFVFLVIGIVVQVFLRFILASSLFTGVLVVLNVFFAFYYILIATFLVDGIINTTKERVKVLPLAGKFKIFKG